MAIYIECKPWAPEGKSQLSDYAEDLLGLPCEHKKLIFAPGRRDRPESEEAKTRLGNSYQKLPFQRADGSSIVEWLERYAARCEAENVRYSLGT